MVSDHENDLAGISDLRAHELEWPETENSECQC